MSEGQREEYEGSREETEGPNEGMKYKKQVHVLIMLASQKHIL